VSLVSFVSFPKRCLIVVKGGNFSHGELMHKLPELTKLTGLKPKLLETLKTKTSDGLTENGPDSCALVGSKPCNM
jgi:hypothetical protein